MTPRRAFTLVEVLIVVAILAVVAAIAFPVFSRAKEASKRTVSISNLRQLYFATKLYQSDYDGEGVYGSRYDMGLPIHTYDKSLANYGFERDLMKSPCGMHPDFPSGTWNVEAAFDNTWWESLTPVYRDGTPMWWDLNCTDHSVKLGNPYDIKRGIAVLLSGTAVSRLKTGIPYHPSFYSDPVQ
jgi:prepilin-type N-terminal cleavage/methylation domain-containing protein